MSEDGIVLILPEYGDPSITIKGSLPESMEACPLILIVEFDPGWPLLAITLTPGTVPCNALGYRFDLLTFELPYHQSQTQLL